MPDPVAQNIKYHAFLSYSHTDRAWAEWLHRGLERYPVPAALKDRVAAGGGAVPRRLFPIFRDREELPTSADLGEQIQAALRESRFLIVVGSPRAATSRWVNEEVRQFKQLGRAAHVLCVIVEGEPNATDGKPGVPVEDECFPPAVRHRVDAAGELLPEHTEPIAADARPQGDGRANALLKLAAGLLGVGFDELRRRDEEEQRRRLRRTRALAALFGLLAVAAAVASVIAMQQKHAAEEQRQVALRQTQVAQEQRRAAEEQRQLAVQQTHLAEEKTRETLQALSRADFEYGSELIERGNTPEGASYLARALRHFPGSLAAAQRLYTLLADRTYQLPLLPPIPAPNGVASWDYSPDGKTLLLHSIKGGYVLFDTTTGQPRSGRLALGGDYPQTARFRSDGELVVLQPGTATMESVIRRWNIESGRTVGSAIRTGITSNSPIFLYDPRTDLAAVQEFNGKALRLWKMETGEPAGPPLEMAGQISRFWLEPSGRLAFVVERQKKLTVFDIATGAVKVDAPEVGGDVAIHDFAFGQLGTFSLATVPNELGRRMWQVSDAMTGQQAGSYVDEDFRLLDARLDPLGFTMMGVGRDGRMHRLAMRGNGTRLSEPVPNTAIAFPVVRPDFRQMVTEFPAHSAQLWSLPPSVPGGRTLLQTRGAIRAALSPDGRHLLVAIRDGKVRQFDATLGDPTAREVLVQNPLVDLAFSRESAWASVAEMDGRVSVFSTTRPGELAWTFEAGGKLPRVQLSPDGGQALVVADGSRVALWDRATHQRVGESVELGLVAGFGFLNGGREFYAARGREIVIFHSADLTPRLRFRAAPDLASLDTATLAPDSTLLAASSSDSGIGLWRVADGQPAFARISLKERVRGLAFSPDQQHLLARTDNDLRIFDLTTSREAAPLLHLLGLRSASFSPDGRLVLTTAQGRARLWDWRTARPVTDALPVTFDAALTSDGRALLRDQFSVCQLMPLPPVDPPPAWLPELMECVSLQKLGDDGISQTLPGTAWLDLRPRLAALPGPDPWSEFGRWFAADPWERALTPGSPISTKEYLEKQLPELQAIMQDTAPANPGAPDKTKKDE